MGSTKLNADISKYLQDKYAREFVVETVIKEFNGYDGDYIHAICRSAIGNEKFNVYCFLDEEKEGNRVTLDDAQYVVADDYAQILFANEMSKDLANMVGEDIFVGCQVKFSDHYITEDEYKEGMVACLNNEELFSHITIYLIGKAGANMAPVKDQVEAYCGNLNAYRQYVYVASLAEGDIDAAKKHYADNLEVFDSHMNTCSFIERVEFTLFRRGEGIAKRSVEKG